MADYVDSDIARAKSTQIYIDALLLLLMSMEQRESIRLVSLGITGIRLRYC